MSGHIQFLDIDVFHNESFTMFNPKKVYLYVEGEYGFIPLICGKAIEGDGTEVATITSRYQNIEAFNRLPKPNDIGWRITQVTEDICFIAITNWYPNSDGKGEPNADLWKNSYPMMYSLLRYLKMEGCEQICTITSMNILDAEQNPAINVHTSDNDWEGLFSDEDSYLALPAWAFPMLADKMGMQGKAVVASQDEGQFIDIEALKKMTIYLQLSGLPWCDKEMEKTISTLMSVETELSSQGFDEDTSMGEFQ